MTSTKDTNPKDAVGTAKVPLSTVSAPVLGEVGLAMLEGALKYGRHNYRVSGVRASVYHDAALRHLLAFWEGQDIDPDSGLPHIVKAIACCVVLRDSQIQGNWVDDRPPKTHGDWVKELNKKAEALLEKYPNPLPAFTELSVAAPLEEAKSEFPEAFEVPSFLDQLRDSGLLDGLDFDHLEVFVDPLVDEPMTAMDLDDADKNYIWESRAFRWRWHPKENAWQHAHLASSIREGWVTRCEGYRPGVPLTRAQFILDSL